MPPIENESDDLRSSIEAAFATDVPESAPAEAVEMEAPVVEEAAVEVAEPKGDHPTDPLRYADGKFKPTKEDAPEKAAPEKVSPSKDIQTKASEVAAQPATGAPPAGWTAAEKAEWQKLPPAVQAAVSRRETEIANGGRQWSEEKRRYEAMIAPVAEASGRRGLPVEQGIQLLIAAQNALDQDPISGIKRIAATYGVDLATLAGQPAADGLREAPQPDFEAMVRRHVQPLLAPIHERIRHEEAQRQQSTVDIVTTFATSPGHEHFDAVQTELMAMIPAIKAANPAWTHEKVLQDAYDRAVYANPSTRSAVLAAAQADAEAKRQADAKARADKARRAGSSVTGSPSGTPTTGPKDSLRAEIEASFNAGG